MGEEQPESGISMGYHCACGWSISKEDAGIGIGTFEVIACGMCREFMLLQFEDK